MKDHIIIADTDSEFIVVKDILNHLGIDKNDKNRIEIILKIAKKLQGEANEHLEDISRNLFNISKNKYFQLKQEVIAQSVIVTGKRRYAMFIVNKEGVTIPPDHKDALDLKGLEVMKSNMNKMFKKFGEELIKNILFGKPKLQIDNDIIQFHKQLKTMEVKSLGKPTGISYISKYLKRKPTVGTIFSTLGLGAPANTKGAIRYNDLLKFKNLDKSYESIIEGDKIYVIDLKANPYGIESIAIPNGKIPAEIEQFIKQYIDADQIFESMILGKLRELYSDVNWDFPSLNSHVNRFLVYED